MKITVSSKPLHGSYEIIACKSEAHRALICAALAGSGTVEHVPYCDDTAATIAACTALGAVFKRSGSTVICSRGVTPEAKNIYINCGESAATLRMLLPTAAALCSRAYYTPIHDNDAQTDMSRLASADRFLGVCFDGSRSLCSRPISPLISSLCENGADIRSSADTSLPVSVRGGLQSGVFHIDGSLSSQYISGLLFALPLLCGASEIRLTSPPVSLPYIKMTYDAVSKAGVKIEPLADGFRIAGGQKYRPIHTVCPIDLSAALPFICAAAHSGEALILSADVKSLDNQADAAVIPILIDAGADIKTVDGGIHIMAPNGRNPSFSPIDFDVKSCPDAAPCLAAFASSCRGVSRIRGVSRLIYKESNRLDAVMSLLSLFGCVSKYENDSIYIYGSSSSYQEDPSDQTPLYYSSDDHRMLMAAAVMAKIHRRPITIEGAEHVSKSFPEFFDIFL